MRHQVLSSLLVLSSFSCAAQGMDPADPASLPAGAWVELARMSASDGASYDTLGTSVAITGDGNTAVGGAPCADYDNGCGSARGEAYVFVKPESGWASTTETAKLIPSDGGGMAGSSVAIRGETVLVGAPYAVIGANRWQGAAYIFTKPATGWADTNETAKLTASDGGASDLFGSSVVLHGDTAVVVTAHSIYVFIKPKGGWKTTSQFTAKLTPSDSGINPLGQVAMTSDTIVVGGPNTTVGSNPLQGVVYVFVKPAAGWANMAETAKLSASDGTAYDSLGWSVAIGGDTIAAGAPIKPYLSSKYETGATYVFVKPVGGWASTTETAKLVAGQGIRGEEMGHGVAVSSKGDKISAAASSGVYRFVEPTTGWASTSEYRSKAKAANGDSLMDSVACSGGMGTMVSGSAYAIVGDNLYQGAVYVFALPVIKAISPESGPIGTPVTLTGTNLAQSSQVTFGGVPATEVTIDSDTKVRAIVPTGAVTGTVKITTPSGQTTSTDAFTVMP